MRHTRSCFAATGLFVAALAAPTPATAQAKAPAAASAINIPFEKIVLPNGLTVILSPDHSVPRVNVDVWYHVGSKNEKPGRTGFAHMFEHVMFTGSLNVPYGTHDRYTEGVGGDNNGSTSNDRTNYYENIPTNYLETALWMEADRMGFLLEKLDEAKFVAQRDIVQNERRQGIDNQPYGRAFEILTSQLLPESNPYSWPVVGYLAELQKAGVDDVKEFFRLYYAPNNATIAIVGDFDPAEARRWVTKYFSDLKQGAPITRPTVPPTVLPAEKRVTFEDRVQLPRLYLAWPTVGEDSEDDKVLDIVAAILSGPRTARLTKELVYDKQSAANVNARQATSENNGFFLAQVTPRPGHSLTEIESTVDSVIARFKREGPTAAEMTKATAGAEFEFVSALENSLAKAEVLINGAVFHGDAGYYKKQYAAIKAVTAADVKRVANKYLTGGRVVLSVVPQAKPDQASKPEQSRKITVAADGGHYIVEGTLGAQSAAQGATQGASFDRTKQPTAGPAPTTTIPTWTKSKLANGAELVVSVKKDLPLVAVTIAFVGGATTYEPANKVGMAGFTAQMLSEGTATKSADDLSNAQQMLGTSIFAGISNESGTLGFTALKDRVDAALALAADMMLNPRFPAEALERIRGRALVGLQQSRDQPNAIAANVFAKVNYGDAHPYGRVATEASVKAITRDDILAFHKAYYTPGHAVISVVGDVDPLKVKASIEKAFASWAKGGERPAFTYPAPPAQRERTIYLVDKPKAAQSVFMLGQPGPDRYTPDYYAIQVMNTLLGTLFQSRLNHTIREVKGYSYGVNSNFAYGRGPGQFQAGGGIVTAKTDSALIEFIKELKGVQGAIPFTADEITQGKDALVQSLPRTFSSVNGVRGAISGIYVQDLSEQYYQEYAAKVNAVTGADLVRVARKYIDLDHLNIIIVGDRAVIEEPLRKTGIAPIVWLDVDGRAVVVP